jgi:hypothetical protein
VGGAGGGNNGIFVQDKIIKGIELVKNMNGDITPWNF